MSTESSAAAALASMANEETPSAAIDGERTPSPMHMHNTTTPFDSSSSDGESSDSSSSDERSSSSSKSDWKIDLATFSRTRIKLLTELNSSTKCGTLLQAYFSEQHNAKLPWTDHRPDYGIFPLHDFFYCPCAVNDPNKLPHSDLNIKLTKAGRKFVHALKVDHKVYYESNKYKWGSQTGSCVGTYAQLLKFPTLGVNAIRRVYADLGSKFHGLKKKKYKKLIKNARKWLRANRQIWAVIVQHLNVTATHICSGLEMSNGLLLLEQLTSKFGHRHAQCLAALLKQLTNLQLRKRDPDTSRLETVQKYMDRVQMIAREASNFPAMNVPIAIPLQKVFALQGLLRSDPKFSTLVTMAYSNDLKDSFDKLTDKFTTVEGLRTKKIQAEYGSSTNLATASVQRAQTGKKKQPANRGNNDARQRQPKSNSRALAFQSIANPNSTCDIKGHQGHKNKDCCVKKLNALRDNGLTAKPRWDDRGKVICQYLVNEIWCPFKSCNLSHRMDNSTTYCPRVNKVAYSDSSSSSDASYARSHRSSRSKRSSRRKHEQGKRRRQKDKRRRHRRMESSSASSSESDAYFR